MKIHDGMKIHIIGIGGTGMSAIALVLAEAGAIVTGSDRSRSDIVSKLEDAGIKVFLGHRSENIGNVDLVIYSSAIPKDNPELREAQRRGIPVKRRIEFLNDLLEDRDVIAVAGTHGKTTTTAMIAWLFSESGSEPGFIIGSTPKNLGKNAALGKSKEFVIEADEYDNMFLGLFPSVAILTRVEHDHPDCFPTMDLYLNAFRKFISQVKPGGIILMNADDPNQQLLKDKMPADVSVYTYGESISADFRATDLEIGLDGCYKFNFLDSAKNWKLPIQLGIPGKHNVFNATVATACCALKNLDLSKVSEALKAFNGIARRFEISAAWNDITIVDDYAHHPTEIQATLSAAKDAFPNRRIWALWQPHTFSRTQTLLPKFIKAFGLADKLLITNIYASRETQTDFGFEDLKKAMINAYPDSLFAETNEQAVEILMNELQPGDVVITLSAGDANQIGPKALERLRAAANDSVKKPHGVILKNEPIAKYSKAMCGGPAKELVIVRSKEDLVSIIKEYQSSGKPFKVVGGLSNILFSDNGFDGLLVINQSDEISFEPQEEKVLVTVDSGAELNRFVKACAEESLTGAEWASLIPGTVGGAIYGNAGAYGGDISHILRSVQFLTDNNEIVDLRNEDLGFGYRTSKFKSGELKGTILSGTFELSRGNYDEIHEKMAVIAEKRQKFNFHGNGSLGSVFRNPQGNYAGKLITECGFNGKRFGNVKVMDDHGNIFITYPGVKSSEFIELIHRVHDAVLERFSIDLTTEIEIMN